LIYNQIYDDRKSKNCQLVNLFPGAIPHPKKGTGIAWSRLNELLPGKKWNWSYAPDLFLILSVPD